MIRGIIASGWQQTKDKIAMTSAMIIIAEVLWGHCLALADENLLGGGRWRIRNSLQVSSLALPPRLIRIFSHSGMLQGLGTRSNGDDDYEQI